MWKGRRIVASEGPPNSATGEDGANEADEEGEENDKKEAERAAFGAGSLGIDCGEWKGAITIEYCVEIRYRVEESNSEKEGGCQNQSVRELTTIIPVFLLRKPNPICAKTPFGRSTLGFGNSSAK